MQSLDLELSLLKKVHMERGDVMQMLVQPQCSRCQYCRFTQLSIAGETVVDTFGVSSESTEELDDYDACKTPKIDRVSVVRSLKESEEVRNLPAYKTCRTAIVNGVKLRQPAIPRYLETKVCDTWKPAPDSIHEVMRGFMRLLSYFLTYLVPQKRT